MTSPRKFPRTARVNEVMLEVLADELERMSDPRLELVTFTGVKVTRDLSYATVYYSTLGATTAGAPESFDEDAASALSKAAAHLRGVVGRQMRIRQVPSLSFELDPGILAGQRIDEILRGIHHEGDEPDQAGAHTSDSRAIDSGEDW
jgi:ribosome-binding factor A